MSAVSIAILVVACLMIVTGMYGLMRTRNIIRLILAIEVAMKAITLLLAFAGNVNGNMALAQGFIITMIVIEVVVAVVAAGIAICVYHQNGSMDISHLTKLNG